MKKLFKKFLVGAAALVAVLMLSTNTADAYAATEITYREQNEDMDTNLIFLEVGEQIDLRFMGAGPEWRTYESKWITTNEEVASVDKIGLVTAKAPGIVNISYVMNDGGKYYTNGVTIVVSEQYEAITLKVNGEVTDSATLFVGEVAKIEVNNLNTFKSGTYAGKWVSSDESVITIGNSGYITAIADGISILSYEAINLSTGVVLPCDAVIAVVGTGIKDTEGTVEPTPEVTPTDKPEENTPTSTPTVTPSVTPTTTPTTTPEGTVAPGVSTTPTPTPVPANFTITVLGETELQLNFSKAVDYTSSAIAVTQSGVAMEVESVAWNIDNTAAIVKLKEYMHKNTSYTVIANTKTVSVSPKFNVPDTVKLSYTSLGKEGRAFALDGNGTDIVVKLNAKLYSEGMDVTNNYINEGYAEFYVENAGTVNFDFNTDEIRFYEVGEVAKISCKFTYWNNKNEEVVLNGGITAIQSVKAPTYLITEIVNWTLVPVNSSATIDWNNVNQEVVAGSTTEYKIVALIKDSYGYTYATDDRGVANDNIHSIDEYNTPLYTSGLSLYFKGNTGNSENYYSVTPDGNFYAYQMTYSAPINFVYIDDNGKEITFGRANARILKEAMLSTIQFDKANLTLSTGAIPGALDGITNGYVGLTFIDQYGFQWHGDTEIVVSSSNSTVNKAITEGSAGVYYMDGKLYVDAIQLRSVVKTNSVRLTVKDEISKKTATIDVRLDDPAYNKDGSIVVSSWALDDAVTLGITPTEEQVMERRMILPLNIYAISRSTVKVDYISQNVYVQNTNKTTFKADECQEGDYYIYVTGPKGKVINLVDSGLGIAQSATGSSLVLTYGIIDGGRVETLDEGTYTVRVIYIQSNDGTTVKTAKKTTTFTIKNDAPTVAIKSCEKEASYKATDKPTAISLAGEVLTLSVNGQEWTGFNAGFIEDIKYNNYNGRFVINSIVVWVPVDNEGTAYVKATVNCNKTVKVPNN